MANSVEDGSSLTGAEDEADMGVEALVSTECERGNSRCSSQSAATSSRETVIEDPELPTASMVRSLWGNGKLSEEVLVIVVGTRSPPANI